MGSFDRASQGRTETGDSTETPIGRVDLQQFSHASGEPACSRDGKIAGLLSEQPRVHERRVPVLMRAANTPFAPPGGSVNGKLAPEWVVPVTVTIPPASTKMFSMLSAAGPPRRVPKRTRPEPGSI